MATKPFLVVLLSRKTAFFGDETTSRRRFETENAIFWRRYHFSSSFCAGKPLFLATRPLLVVFLSHETSLFGDETTSRCLFEPRNLTFWRRDPFSSPFLAVKPHFLATRSLLVVNFWQDATDSVIENPFLNPLFTTKIYGGMIV
ncbi:hypothetical protein [Caldifermentibacillus hisashii]|uniref:hypothetical protein n=1 Tax=Caldifermentibacillus hisashii TaxID=996558 RepID=UPI001C10974A|nr:hypothetical protein [Caldifermentibacillus hisashii]MBU5340895.1 hypothetical protein [Caldifermentibacillus hisashii]